MKKAISVFSAALLVLSLGLLSAAITKESSRTLDYYRANKTLSSWWDVAALASAGENVKTGGYTLPDVGSAFLGDPAVNKSATLLASRILVQTALGMDPRTCYASDMSLDLIRLLESKQSADGSFGFINDQIFAIIALESTSNIDYDRDKALRCLIDGALPDGSYTYWGDVGEADLTGMALTVFSYFKGNPAADAAAAKCIAWLEKNLGGNGGYPSVWSSEGKDNAAGNASVISGLAAYGVDFTKAPFKKLYDRLLAFRLGDGGFIYEQGETSADAFSTPQALLALTDVENKATAFKRNAELVYSPLKVYTDVSVLGANDLDTVSFIKRAGVMSGTGGKFMPAAGITRAEAAMMLYKLGGMAASDIRAFSDVAENVWYYKAVSYASKNLYMVGGGDGTFLPAAFMTRQELACVLARRFGFASRGVDSLRDSAKIAVYARDSVGAVLSAGVMSADEKGSFNPAAKVTRLEAAKAFAAAIKKAGR